MTGGDVITALGGQAGPSAACLSTALAGYSPGQQVTDTWAETGGGVHSATVTLGSGPAL
jgi:S1-C subfamily serine protease